jgi:hypothetical protein
VATIKAYNTLLPSKQAEVARRVLAADFRKEDFAFRELQARKHITTLVYLPDSDYRFDSPARLRRMWACSCIRATTG